MRVRFTYKIKQNGLTARSFLALLALFLSLNDSICIAQLKGNHILGDQGMFAGTQQQPSVTVSVPFYWYDANKLIDSKGDVASNFPNVTAFTTGIITSVVTNLKILNANYCASLFVAGISNNYEGNVIQLNVPFALTDMYVQPVQLGWHTKRADFKSGYGLYIPMGKYQFGAKDNTGLGMWGHELSAGTTLFLNSKKTLNFSSGAFYETHSRKKDTTMKAGDIMTVEGGLAKTFFKKVQGSAELMQLNLGLVYYAQFKLTEDQLPAGSRISPGAKDHIYSLGIEGNTRFPKALTAVSFKWFAELGAKNRFQGNTYVITLTQPLLSFQKKKEYQNLPNSSAGYKQNSRSQSPH